MGEIRQSKLSGLYAYRTKLTDRHDELVKQRTVIDTQIEEVVAKIAGVNKGIEGIEGRTLLITSHFIDRYRQRVGPEDATEDHIKAHIITPQLLNMITTLGSGVYPVDCGMVVVEDNKLITINTPMKKEKPIYKVIKQPGRVKPRNRNK